MYTEESTLTNMMLRRRANSNISQCTLVVSSVGAILIDIELELAQSRRLISVLKDDGNRLWALIRP